MARSSRPQIRDRVRESVRGEQVAAPTDRRTPQVAVPSHSVLKCKFCPYTTPEWYREHDKQRGNAFREGWRGLEAHVACIHPKEYSKIKKGLAQFDQDKKWALKL